MPKYKMGSEKIEPMKKKGLKLSNLKDIDMDKLPIRNSQIKNFDMLRNKNESKEAKKVNIGEDKMFTDDPWFNTGLVIGRNIKNKKNKKK